MLHNARASAVTPRFADTDPGDLLASNETLKSVICPICQATYRVASSQQQTAQPVVILESAFLRVCHFCFRCQRPACPQCWNPVHHVCAACGEEACLPFLAPVPSLEGLIFAPSVFPSLAQTADVPFTCLHNGRFYTPGSQPRNPAHLAQPAEEVSSTTGQTTPAQSTTEHSAPACDDSYPVWLQEIMSQQENNYATEPPLHYAQQQVSTQKELDARPAPVEDVSMTSDADWPGWWQEARTTPQSATLLTNAVDKQKQENMEVMHTYADEETTPVERIENILIVVMSVVLLSLILMIVLAVSSASVNEFFVRLLHIDIRGEITYLLQSI